MGDLVKWLRAYAKDHGVWPSIFDEAADRIEALEARVRELSDDNGCCHGCGSTMSLADLRKRGAIACCPERRMLSASEWRAKAMALEAEVQRLRGEGSDTSHNRFQICGYQRRPKWHWPKAEWTACSSQEATGHFDRAPDMEYRPIYAATEPTNE